MIVISRRYVRLFIIMMVLGIGAGWGMQHERILNAFHAGFGNYSVILDAGHGAPDGGAVGVTGVLEKDINLAITLKLQEILEGQGINVILTRSDDSGLHNGSGSIHDMKVADMKKRLEIMKSSDADLFISIHMNSFGNSSVNGLHIFYDPKHESIKPLAESIQSELAKSTGAEPHDIKPAASTLYLMKNSPIPSILAECGFLSNPSEEKKLANDEYQSKIAWAIGKAVIEYFNENAAIYTAN